MTARRPSLFRSRFLWKLFAGYGLLLLLTLAVVGELVAANVRGELLAETRAELVALLDRFEAALGEVEAPAPGSDDPAAGESAAATARRILASSAGRLVVGLAEARGVTLEVYDADNRLVVVLPVPPAAARPAVGGAPDVVSQARTSGETVAGEWWSGRRGAGSFAVARSANGAPPGWLGDHPVLLAARPLAGLDARLGGMRELFVTGSLLALLCAFGLAWLHTRAVDRPLLRMSEVARAMGQGDFTRRVPILDRDSFGELAQALNRLGTASRDRMDTMTTDRNRVLAILGAMVEGVIAVDANERVVHMNAAAGRILGTQAAAAEGRRVWEVTRVREVSECLGAALRTGEEQEGEVRVVAPPRDRWVELHANPLQDADRITAGAVVVLHDVSELRRLEAIRKDFVANVSHELKTPITAIRGLVETVLDDPEMEVPFRERFLGRIRDQAHRLSSLVSDLLTLSRLESAGSHGESTVFDLRGPVRESVAALTQPAEARGITIEVDIPAEPLRIQADADSIRVAASNLLDNAVKYTPEGGHVWVRLEKGEADVTLVVEDTGIGIDKKHLERIFQRFYRVDKARSRELGGTGLGLSIVKHICIAYGGEVTVDSVPGRGSSFRLRLPLA